MLLLPEIVDSILIYSGLSTLHAAYRLNKRISTLLKSEGFWREKLENNGLPFIDYHLEHISYAMGIPVEAVFRLRWNIFHETDRARITADGILFVHDVENARNFVNHTIVVNWLHSTKESIACEFVWSLFPQFNKNGARIRKEDYKYYVNDILVKTEDLKNILITYVACRNLLPVSISVNDEGNKTYLYPSSGVYRNGIWDAYITL